MARSGINLITRKAIPGEAKRRDNGGLAHRPRRLRRISYFLEEEAPCLVLMRLPSSLWRSQPNSCSVSVSSLSLPQYLAF